MEGHAELQGWELLPRIDPLRPSSASAASDEDGGDPFGLIAADYFVLDSGGKSGVLEEEKRSSELTQLGDIKLAEKDPIFDQLAVDESPDSTKEAVVYGDNSVEEEMDLGGEVCSEEDSDVSWLDSWGDEIGGMREFKQVEDDESSPRVMYQGDSFLGGDNNLDGHADGAGEKKGDVWWKMPLELVKFCVFRVRPVWSVSIAAAVVGLVVLSRRLYRMKRQSRRIHLAAIVDDKKASLIPAMARLNEALTVPKHTPSIKASLPATGVTPWPTMALRI